MNCFRDSPTYGSIIIIPSESILSKVWHTAFYLKLQLTTGWIQGLFLAILGRRHFISPS